MSVFGQRRRSGINYDEAALAAAKAQMAGLPVGGVPPQASSTPAGMPSRMAAPASPEAENQYIMHGRSPDGSYGQAAPVFSRGQYESGEAVRPFVNAGGTDERGASVSGLPIASAPSGMFAGGKKKHKGLFPGKDSKVILNTLGRVLEGFAAGMGVVPAIESIRNRGMRSRMQMEAELAMEKERAKAMQPRFEQVGDTYGMFEPQSQQFKPIFRDPQPFEAYAESLGYEPGSEEYHNAVQDYRLGSWSDPAMQNRTEFEGVRYGYRDQLQDQRLGVTVRGQDIRSRDTRRGQDITRGNNIRSTGVSRDNNIRSTGQSNTNNVRSTNQSNVNSQRSAMRPTRGGRGGAGNGPVAVGPNGEQLIVKNGAWVDARTGRPVQ